jgi:2,3-bisphosphoglycerate-independent phosphoglycerate mutase
MWRQGSPLLVKGKKQMKYVVVLYDGMADMPVPALDNKTPMEVANKPIFDSLGKKGEVGLVKTIPDGMKPGSDVANLSVLGYDPSASYTGRSPLEAVSIGVDLLDTDVTLRCNLVTLSDEEKYEDKTMIDYSGGDISTAEAKLLIDAVQEHFGSDIYRYFNGVAYRHCLVWHNGTTSLGKMTPPHDISERVIGPYLSDSENAADLLRMMRESYDILKDHPVNKKRVSEGKRPANSIWLWGEGTKPQLPLFKDVYGLEGSIISAVDLLRGIGGCAGMSTPIVEGATGYLDTNFEGKAEAAVNELKNGKDFVYIHIEATDECGHRKEIQNKVKAIEEIDNRVLPILLDALKEYDDYKIMILPDHPTPLSTGTHSSDPVPFMIYHKNDEKQGVDTVTEKTAADSGIFYGSGVELMKHFLS